MKAWLFIWLLILITHFDSALLKPLDSKEVEKIYDRYKKFYDKEETVPVKRQRRRLDDESTFTNYVTEADSLRSFTPTAAEEDILKTLYFPAVTQAKQDSNDYSGLTGIYATEEGRAMYYYSLNPPKNYVVEFPNPSVYEIRMKINPCEGRTTDLCCDATNEGACGDDTVFESGEDMVVAWFTNGYIFHCSDVFEKTNNWGTYIEIHRPTDYRVIEFIQVEQLYRSGYSTEFISTKQLCAGRYELWFVIRSRNGKALQHVKPFYSIEPGCTDEQVAEAAGLGR